jgi:predicted AAA+ superfamily ATPase
MRSKDLRRAIVLGRLLTQSVDRPEIRRRIWLLDEVTSIDGWTATIKYLRDNTMFGDETVACTGSSWSESGDVERDMLAGRSGSAAGRRSRLPSPMHIHDFVSVTRGTIWQNLVRAVPPQSLADDRRDGGEVPVMVQQCQAEQFCGAATTRSTGSALRCRPTAVSRVNEELRGGHRRW